MEMTHKNVELSANVSTQSALVQDVDDAFVTIISVETTTNIGLNINVECQAVFVVDSKIDINFLKSSFVTLNAPAIVYPFVRSFVSNLSVNAGFPAIILPAINFAAKDREKE
ncbi:MAG: protein-export chaperone SecB [Bacteroidales bacterium]|nr:protein-export chaperone SecB [Bacteroidales bacterium]